MIRNRWLEILFGVTCLAIALLLAACPKPGPTPPGPDPLDLAGLPACDTDTKAPQSEDVCGDKSVQGLRCVACEVGQACLHKAAMIYCTPTCRDPRCK